MSTIQSFDPVSLAATDLRRRNRQHAEVLVQRAEFLAPADREILQAIFRDGRSAADLSRLAEASVPGSGAAAPSSARALRRRVHRLVMRVLSPRFVFVAAHLKNWPPTRRAVAAACVLNGRTMRQAALELKLTLHRVRTHLAAVNARCEDAGV